MMRPTPKQPRLSASTATGLAGLRENHYVATFMTTFAKTAFVNDLDIRSAVNDLISTGGVPHGLLNYRDAKDLAVRSANVACLWVTFAVGALVQRTAGLGDIEMYIGYAKEWLRVHFDEVCEEALRAHLLLAFVMALIEDAHRLQHHLEQAFNIARSLTVERRMSTGPRSLWEGRTKNLNLDLWYLLQCCTSVDFFFGCEALEYSTRTTPNSIIAASTPWTSYEMPSASTAIPTSPFMPVIPDLPDVNRDTIKSTLLQDGTLYEAEIDVIVKQNVVNESLSELAKPDLMPEQVQPLFSIATGGGSRLLQITLAIEHRSIQLMMLRVKEGKEKARPAALRMRVLVDRVKDALGFNFLAYPGLNQFKLVSSLLMILLVLGEESRSLQLLEVLRLMLMEAPGIMRMTSCRRHYHSLGALFAAAGKDSEAESLAKVFCSLENTGAGQPPPAATAMELHHMTYKCGSARCYAVRRILDEDGGPDGKGLLVFNRHAQLRDAIPKDVVGHGHTIASAAAACTSAASCMPRSQGGSSRSDGGGSSRGINNNNHSAHLYQPTKNENFWSGGGQHLDINQIHAAHAHTQQQQNMSNMPLGSGAVIGQVDQNSFNFLDNIGCDFGAIDYNRAIGNGKMMPPQNGNGHVVSGDMLPATASTTPILETGSIVDDSFPVDDEVLQALEIIDWDGEYRGE